jgi:hypothetical protein
LGRGDLVGVGYTMVEVVRGCDWVMREGGGLIGAKTETGATGAQFRSTPHRGLLFQVEGTWVGLGKGNCGGCGWLMGRYAEGEGWVTHLVTLSPSPFPSSFPLPNHPL